MYAALEDTPEITAEQLQAACKFADYQRESQAHVFMGLGESLQARTENRILESLRRHGPQPGWRLRQRVRHVSAETLARALAALARIGAIESRKRGRGESWHLVNGV